MTSSNAEAVPKTHSSSRIASIDALRGFVMFTMIFVNDLAGAPEMIVPSWMRHFHGKSGMTFVDLVFPAFLFIVGMSIPFGLGSRLKRGDSLPSTIAHIVTRTLALLVIGIIMVNESPDSVAMGWSSALWSVLLYVAAIMAFCTISPPSSASADQWRAISRILRFLGFGTIAFLALTFRGLGDQRIVTFAPFSVRTEWYGILGLIGWAYLVGSITYLLFRTDRAALLAVIVLLLGLYVADRNGVFQDFWLNRFVGIGGTLGSQASITVAGLLLASILITPNTGTVRSRTRFTVLFIAGCAAGALELHGLYGINKNAATPSWCLWAAAITAALWLAFYFFCDVHPVPKIVRPLSVAGANVFLAYLISEMLPSALVLVGVNHWYNHLAELNLPLAIARSVTCGLTILFISIRLNQIGFRLKI